MGGLSRLAWRDGQGTHFLNSVWDGRLGQLAFELDMPNRRKQKLIPGRSEDLWNQYHIDLSAKLAYRYPENWTTQDKQSFNPSCLKKKLQPDNASSIIINGESFKVISIP